MRNHHFLSCCLYTWWSVIVDIFGWFFKLNIIVIDCWTMQTMYSMGNRSKISTRSSLSSDLFSTTNELRLSGDLWGKYIKGNIGSFCKFMSTFSNRWRWLVRPFTLTLKTLIKVLFIFLNIIAFYFSMLFLTCFNPIGIISSFYLKGSQWLVFYSVACRSIFYCLLNIPRW